MANESATNTVSPAPPQGFRLLARGERTQPGDLLWVDGPTSLVLGADGPCWTKFAPSLNPRPVDWPVAAGKRDHYCRAVDQNMVDPTVKIFEDVSIDLRTGKPTATVN